jgi:hypothetical protein
LWQHLGDGTTTAATFSLTLLTPLLKAVLWVCRQPQLPINRLPGGDEFKWRVAQGSWLLKHIMG